METRKFDDFNVYAKDYREIHNENIKISGADSEYFSKYKIVEISRNEKKIKPDKILDLGCGDGTGTKYFSDLFPASQIYGVDVSDTSIEVAKGKNIPNTTFLHYNGTKIPFEDESFDIILIAGVMHHINPQYHVNLLKEVYRVLKKGRRLYIFEHNPINPLTKKIVRDCIFDEDAILLFPTYAKKIAKLSNFEKVNIKFTIFIPRIRIFKKILFLERLLTWLPLGGQYYVKSTK